LVAPHVAEALALAALILGGRADAADVVQDALLSAWGGLSSLRDPNAFRPWFRRHVARRAAKVARRRIRTVPLDLAEMRTGESVEEASMRRQLDRAFVTLEPRDRALLALRFYLGLSTGETAEVLGIKSGTVKSRLHTAVGRLRAAFDSQGR
jgi:RNA polymerase sigma-70 factor (ECF subfamily)